jgi:polar amino acid transport system substrate-binding protein
MQNALLQRATSSWRYTGLSSLDRVSIGFVQGYVFPGEIGQYLAAGVAAKSKNVSLITGDMAGRHNVTRLAIGRVDVIAEDVSVVAYERVAQNIVTEFREAAAIGGPEPIFIAFSPMAPNARQLAAQLDEGIARLRSSGKLDAIMAQYGLKDWEKR